MRHAIFILSILGALVRSQYALAQTCPGVSWSPGAPGERIYTCRSQFSSSRTPAGQSTWDDGLVIQDAIDHTTIPGCEAVGNGTRIVTILPGPPSSHRGACVVRASIVLASNSWLRGLPATRAGAPSILKLDDNSLTIDPVNSFQDGRGTGLRILTTSVGPHTNISVTDLEIDGSAIPVHKLINPTNGLSVCMMWDDVHMTWADHACELASGILADSLTGGTVKGVSVHDVLGDGVYLHGASSNVSIIESSVYRSWRVGINFDGLSQSVIAANRIWSVAFPALDTEDHTGDINHVIVAQNAVLPGPVAGDARLDPPPVAGDPPDPVTVTGIELASGMAGDPRWSKTLIAKNRIDLGRSGAGVLIADYGDVLVADNQIDIGGRALGDGGSGIQVIRNGSGLLVSSNVIQGIQETTAPSFCTLPGAAQEPSNAAIDVSGGTSVLSARGNIVHDAVTGLRSILAPSDTLSFLDNIAIGQVPPAGSGSAVIHWGVEMPGGSHDLISDNIIGGYDRQLEFTSFAVSQLSLLDNALLGGAVGRPIPGASNGNGSESAGLTFDETTSVSMQPFSVLGNIATPASGGSTFLPIRHAQVNVNAGFTLGTGELELGRNFGLDAITYVYWDPSVPISNCPSIEASRTPTPLTTIAPGASATGKATVSGSSNQVTVTFIRPLSGASYRVVAFISTKTGAPPAGATRVATIGTKTTTGFVLRTEAAPGIGNSTTFDWMVFP